MARPLPPGGTFRGVRSMLLRTGWLQCSLAAKGASSDFRKSSAASLAAAVGAVFIRVVLGSTEEKCTTNRQGDEERTLRYGPISVIRMPGGKSTTEIMPGRTVCSGF